MFSHINVGMGLMGIDKKWDRRFLNLAQLVASWSKDPSTQVGAVLVEQNRRVISVGFNGFPQAMPDTEALYANREEKYSRIIHAEVNALHFAGRLPKFTTLYTWPLLPCDRCVVQMIQAGVFHFIAPKPSADVIERWGAALFRTRSYITECNLTYEEM